MEPRIRLGLKSTYPSLPLEGFFGTRLVGLGPDEAVVYYEHGRDRGRCVLVHLREGRAERHELAVDPSLLALGPSHPAAPVLFRADGHLWLAVRHDLLWRVDASLRVHGEVSVEPLPHVSDLCRSAAKGLHLATRPGATDGSVVPLFFPGDRVLASDATRYLALLAVDAGAMQARWLGPDPLFHLSLADFPTTRVSDGSPWVQHALFAGGRLHTYVVGNNPGHLKWGMEYFGIATYDEARRPVARPYFEHPAPDEPKKRGRKGAFTTSAAYCILTPSYPTSDPWKHTQRLFDLEANVLHEVGLPRGFTRHQVVDHAAGTFWLLEADRSEVRIASAQAG